MHISKIVDYVKNEISFSEEFCEDNVLVTLRIEPILKIIENLEQSHKYILEYDKEIRNKDRQIDLMAEQLAGLTIWDNEKEEPLILADKEEVIKYFEKKRQITVKSDKIVVERKD